MRNKLNNLRDSYSEFTKNRNQKINGNLLRIYDVPTKVEGFEVTTLVESMDQWLQNNKFRTQVLQTGLQKKNVTGILVQVEKSGRWRKVTGMSTALNVVFEHDSNTNKLKIQIGEGRWMDKVVGGTFGLLLLWPLLITSTVGIYQQSTMPRYIFNFIHEYLKRGVHNAQSLGAENYAQIPDDGEMDDERDSLFNNDYHEYKTKTFQQQDLPTAEAQAVTTDGAEKADDTISKLERLAKLKEKGILTEEEFQSQKIIILEEALY